MVHTWYQCDTKVVKFWTPIKCFIYSVEWQKHGLFHAHILLWLQTKLRPSDVDTILSTEFPNPNGDPLLYDIVRKNMVHGPCGHFNAQFSCMAGRKCTKKYPRKLLSEMQTRDDGYLLRCRRAEGQGRFTTTIKQGSNKEL